MADASTFYPAWQASFNQSDYKLSEALMFASEAKAIAQEVLTFGVNAPSYGYLPSDVVRAAFSEVVARQGTNQTTLAFKYDLNVTLTDKLMAHPESAAAIGARVSKSWQQMYPDSPIYTSSLYSGGGGGGGSSDSGGDSPPESPAEDPWWYDDWGSGGTWVGVSDPMPYGHSVIGVSMLLDSGAPSAATESALFSNASISSLIQDMAGMNMDTPSRPAFHSVKSLEHPLLYTTAANALT